MNPFEEKLFDTLLVTGFAAAAVVFVVLFFVDAPYGRHMRTGWGPKISNRTAWRIMESPAVLAIALCYFSAKGAAFHPGALLLLGLWEVHYLHRALIFPFRLPQSKNGMPLSILAMAIAFNVCNGYLNGRYLGIHAGDYGSQSLVDPRFLTGGGIFLAGMAINLHADRILLNLRAPGETDYKIPRGGLYRWLSCPNYFGECLEWTGWAIAAWSAPSLLFALWTAANLVPRAHAHHRWYQKNFDDYPTDRKAILPFIF